MRVPMHNAMWVGAVLLLGVAGASAPLAAQSPSTIVIAGRSGANPSLASRGDFVALTFSAATASGMDVYVATSRDGGRTFGTPSQVNTLAGQARVSGEQPPRVALVPRARRDPDIVVVWTVKTGTDWQLLQARSTDFGRTFSTAAPVPGSDAAGARGWEAVDVDEKGRVNVLWLDHRDAAATMTHTHAAADAPKPDPTERAKLSRLYYGTLGTTNARSLTQSVCYCCKTALVHAGGATYAAWRQVYPGSIRDIAFSRSRDGGRTFTAPVKVSDDRWQIDGCPDNGPSLAVDAAQQVHVIWPTAAGEANAQQLALYYARSTKPGAAGGTFTPRVKVPASGQASHPTMVIGGDGVPFVVWDEIVDGQRRVQAARVGTNGRFTPVAVPGTGARWYPSAARVSGGAVVAWVQSQPDKSSAIGITRIALP
jgi:hypothetical protein